VTHAVGKRWIAGKNKGSVVSIVVTWVWAGSPFVVPSAMSKAGVHIMTKSLAVEWGRYGIRLNAIAPGIFPTEGAGKRLAPGRDFREEAVAVNPMRRIGNMPELQNLAAFLMSDQCEFLTGQTIAIDGGANLVNGGSFNELFEWGDAEWKAAREAIMAQNEKDKAKRST
jgi:NAD(P)-dependent dehydrogenase (short-subunit alcohol dehydrogenase family)